MESRKLTPLKNNNPSGKFHSQIQEIINFLNENYDIRVNCFDPSRSVITSKKKQYLFPPSFDDISLHCTDSGMSVSDTILRKILRSPNQVKTYNPITEYFEGLRKQYKGVSHIDLLLSHLTARDFGDKEEGYYQARMCRIVRKWLVATVACALGKHPNEAALGFIQREEGVGKTYLTRFLVPDPLKEFYVVSQNPNHNFLLEDAFAKNLIVNFDEMVGISNRTSDEFKKVISDRLVVVKHYRDPFPMTVPRIASAMFTTNRTEELGGFISSNMGTRRFACIELDGINQAYSTKVDLNQLWAEAVMLMDQEAFDYQFLQEDYKEFKLYNERYREQTSSLRLIESYYTKPISEEEGEYMQPQQMLQEMLKLRLIPAGDRPFVTPQKIGEALNQLKFARKGVRFPGIGVRYVYHVMRV
jgi:predicted P-loop ATPase